MSAGVVLLIGLVVIALFHAFPSVMTTGDAQLQRWIGPDAARLSFLGLALAVGAGAIWVAVQGTRETAARPAWLVGVGVGAVVGVATMVHYVVMDAISATGEGLQVPSSLAMAALLLGSLAVGIIAARAVGRIGAGAVAGFWYALVLSLLGDVGLLAGDLMFAHRLAQTAWVGYSSRDALCTGVRGATLMGCAVGDDLGFAATLLIFGPVLGLGLGALAGLAGRALAQRQPEAREQGSTATLWSATLRPVIVFSAFLTVVMVAELLGNLW
ncbi:MAG: hypothetical protein IVW57_01100 [Ktedonobacterales bacterium]|nr:hypothetical protein [Ktedonobacterales bacterium]